jgi:hypothetical protein
MITKEKFYGGAEARTSSGTLRKDSSRVQACWNSSPITITLPSGIRSDETGFWFLVTKNGSGSVTVTDGVVSKTITSGCVKVFKTPSSWVFNEITAARTFGNSARGSIENPEEPTTFDPFCLVGDGCELAGAAGNVPLDGIDGRDKAVIPMFQDMPAFCGNQTREPIRAADVIMPKVIPLQFFEDEFIPDSNHPLAATTLSEGFYEALWNAGRPHPVTYKEAVTEQSRHWHHMTWGGVFPSFSWFLGEITAKKHIWERTKTYKDAEGTTRTLVIRVVAEHTLTTEPGPDPTEDPGSKNIRDVGAWGSLIDIYVFTDELEPGFEDGDSFLPAEWSKPVDFTRTDAAVTTNDDPALIACHPQLVIHGCIPTTFEAPMGYWWVPPEETKFGKLFMGPNDLRLKNRKFCYKISNGTPWLRSGCTSTYPGGVGIFGNVVFGWSSGTYNGKGMTLGGGFPKSKPTEFITWSNGSGWGLTYLKPTKPGWNDVCGELDVAGGSSGSIVFCTDDRYGVRDEETGVRRWNVTGFKFNECSGHPDEPLETVGGGHQCFNNNGGASGTRCCIKVGSTTVSATSFCLRSGATYDESGNPISGFGPEVASSAWTQAVLFYKDHFYGVSADGDDLATSGKTIYWSRFLPDPDQVFNDYTYAGSGTGWSGSWSFGANITGSATNANLVKTFAYRSTFYRDLTFKAKALAAQSAIHGIGCLSDGSSPYRGFMAYVQYSSGTNGTAKIEYHDGSGTATLLASRAVTNFNSQTVELEIEQWGTDIFFRWKIGANAQEELTAQACIATTTGYPALAVLTSGVTAQFNTVSIEDASTDFLECTGTMGQDFGSAFFPKELQKMYNTCERTEPDPPIFIDGGWVAYSTAWTESVSRGSGGDYVLPNMTCSPSAGYSGTVGSNPTYPGGPMPNPCRCDGFDCAGASGIPGCVQAPPPNNCFNFRVFTSCDDRVPADIPKFCQGLGKWCITEVACS